MKLTIDVPDDLLGKLDEYVAKHIEHPITREVALLGFLQKAVAPLAIALQGEQQLLADQWEVGQVEIHAGLQPYVALKASSGPNLLHILDDRSAASMATLLIEMVQERSPTRTPQ